MSRFWGSWSIATFGNATELIIGGFALLEGLVDVVQANIFGAILCNVLLVLGISTCVGSIKHGRLRFARHVASQYASMLAICVVGLLLPTFAELQASRTGQTQIGQRGFELSLIVGILLLIGYVCSVLFSVFHLGDRPLKPSDPLEPPLGAVTETAIDLLRADQRRLVQRQSAPATPRSHRASSTAATQAEGDTPAHESAHPSVRHTAGHAHKPPLLLALGLLLGATAGLGWLSEILVGTIEPFTAVLGWNPAFVGLVFLPLVGSFPEYYNTAKMALDHRVEMVLAASAGSSIQIALLVAPALVLLSTLTAHHLDLFFSVIELAVLGVATFLYSEITQDGELVWLEGALLLLIYAMMGATVFLFGA